MCRVAMVWYSDAMRSSPRLMVVPVGGLTVVVFSCLMVSMALIVVLLLFSRSTASTVVTGVLGISSSGVVVAAAVDGSRLAHVVRVVDV